MGHAHIEGKVKEIELDNLNSPVVDTDKQAYRSLGWLTPKKKG